MRRLSGLLTARAIGIALLAFLAVAIPVLAIVYSATFTITENSSTAYTMLPVGAPSNNDWMAANGFFNSTANDTRVTTLGGTAQPWMVADNATWTAVPVPADSQTNLYFTTGNSEAASMDIITGYGGYVRVTDAAVMEPSNNFSIELTGWADTGASGNLVNKSGALRVFTGSGNITTLLWGASAAWYSQNSHDISYQVYSALPRYGQRFDSFTGYITSVSFYTSKNGAPTGTGYARVRAVSDDSIIGTIASIDVSTIAAGAGLTVFNTTPVEVYPAQDIRITFEYSGGGAGDNIRIYHLNTNVAAGVLTTYDGAVWTDEATKDMRGVVSREPALTVTATGVSAASHNVTTTADGTDLKIYIDGVEEDSVALAGASIPNNSNNWTIGTNNVLPYMDYYSYAVGGTPIVLYQPNDIISGTNLPDRTGTAQNGTITWGVNPSNVGATLSSLVAATQPAITFVEDETPTDILPEAPAGDWFIEPDVSGTLLTHPLRPFVTILSDSTTLSERQAWVNLGLAFVLFVLVLTAKSVRGHHIITGVATGVAVGACVVQTIFPMWALVFVVLAVVAGVVAERSPSL